MGDPGFCDAGFLPDPGLLPRILAWDTKSRLGGKPGRVTAGDYSPAVPTDPDVPVSGIRLLGLGNRCMSVDAVNNTRLGERIVRRETDKLYPRHAPMPRAAMEPLTP